MTEPSLSLVRNNPVPPPRPCSWESGMRTGSSDGEDVLGPPEHTWPLLTKVWISPQEPTCLQTRLKLYEQGLRGSLTSLMGSLTMMARHYEQHCPPTQVSAPIRSPSRAVSFEEGRESVGRHLWLWAFGTPNGLNQ